MSFPRAIKGLMVFQECLGPEEARWDERANSASDRREEATVDGTENQR